MAPKRKATPRTPTARQQTTARTCAERQAESDARATEARVARDTRRAVTKEELESIHEVDHEAEFDPPELGVAPTPMARPITTNDLLAIMMQLQQ